MGHHFSKSMPKVEKYMTAMPHTIGKSIPIQRALEMMRDNQIRHLPVQEGGHLIGVLTDRDVKLAASFQGASELVVEDVMTPDPYTVTPDMDLDVIALQMAEHKYGCAVVQQRNGKVVGIFTTTDVARVLALVLKNNYEAKN